MMRTAHLADGDATCSLALCRANTVHAALCCGVLRCAVLCRPQYERIAVCSTLVADGDATSSALRAPVLTFLVL